MAEKVREPAAFTVQMANGRWGSCLGGQNARDCAAEIELTCAAYVHERRVLPELRMHPDTYTFFVTRLFDGRSRLRNWPRMPKMTQVQRHPRDTITFCDDPE